MNDTLNIAKFLADYCLKLLSPFSNLLDAYVSDYFLINLYDVIPKAWVGHLSDITLADLPFLLPGGSDSHNLHSHVLPLWLLSFRAACHSAQLNVKQTGTCLLPNHDIEVALKDLNLGCLPHVLPSPFSKKIKPKKQYEIMHQAEVVSRVAKETTCNQVIDIGGGQGHLSRLLSLGHGLEVTCLEASSSHAPKATKLDLEAKYSLEKRVMRGDDSQLPGSTPHHCTAYLEHDATDEDFLRLLPQNGNDQDSDGQNHQRAHFVMTGLHACGDLTPTLLRLFVTTRPAIALVTVGCCYMKMSSCGEERCTGYPLSKYLQDQKVKLSFQALEAACHFVSAYRSRLVAALEGGTGSPEWLQLRGQVYRVVLQQLLAARIHGDDRLRGQVKCSVKNSEKIPFRDYAQKALLKLGLSFQFTEEELSRGEDAVNSRWMEVIRFYVLRLVLTPVVETLILMDRVIFLLEAGVPCSVISLFDPSISPRNLGIIALKMNQ